jgi:hypothetical protein
MLITLGAIFAITAFGDFFCWGAWPGVGWGIFAASLGVLLVAGGVRSRTGWIALGLLAASCAQMAVEPCFTGFVVVGTLLVAIFAESACAALPQGWARWSEAFFALWRGPVRWLGFGSAVTRSRTFAAGADRVDGDQLAMLVRMVMPALALAAVFGVVLGWGNAIFAEFFSRAMTQAWKWVRYFDWSLARVIFWVICATLGVALFWPPPAPAASRWWTRSVPRWTRPDRRVAFWQSVLVLAALNVLFFAANTIDAVYLWNAVKLPIGMTASRFVHEGVHDLVSAVLLAGVTLTILFQQDAEVVGSRLLKGLALGWIVQNLMLIASVVLRLKIYVEAFQLSELRVYVACFLLLVATGFVLLAWRVVQGMNLGRLLLANVLATFALFFVLQFADVGKVVAEYNVAQWKRAPNERTLDVDYLRALGSSGWEALLEVRESGLKPAATRAEMLLREIAQSEGARLARQDWREWQARRDPRTARLVGEVQQWPPVQVE